MNKDSSPPTKQWLQLLKDLRSLAEELQKENEYLGRDLEAWREGNRNVEEKIDAFVMDMTRHRE